MSEIINDENVMRELEQKVKDLIQEIKDLEQKKTDFQQEILDLEQKRRDLEQERRDVEQKRIEHGENISDEVITQISEVLIKLTEKIAEITSQIDEKRELFHEKSLEINSAIEQKNEKIKEIRETLNIPEVPPAPPIPESPLIPPVAPVAPVPELPKPFLYTQEESEHDKKMRKFEEKIVECERKIEIKKQEIERFNEQMNSKIDAIENKKSRLEDTLRTIDEKLDENISGATRERLEDMRDEVEDKIGELEDKIGELEDRHGELEDELSELHDRIEEINEEREDYEHGYVDEDIIGEIEEMAGFDENFEYEALEEIKEVKEINIEMVESVEKKYTSVSSEAREKRRKLRRESRYNVNFCSGAKIDSFCCYNNEEERPENLIDDDPGIKTKWDASHKHRIEIGHPHWVVIDLGNVKIFNYIQIIKASESGTNRGDKGNRSMDMSAWRIEVSNDKQNWTEFNRETNDQTSIYEKQFEPQTGRYIRLLVDVAEKILNPKTKAGDLRIYYFGIKMRDEFGDVIEDLTKNARIDSFCHQHHRDERPENILNNRLDNKWCATDRHIESIDIPHWIIIDFGESKTFNHLRMIKASEGSRDRGNKNMNTSAWRFEVSEDKENWTEFNKETNDQSSIYTKTFEPQTGRYVKLWVDAGGNNPNNKKEDVRIYDLRIEMVSESLEDKVVTFDDIIAIAPFAKKETLDKLADKLTDIDNFTKVKEIGKYLSTETINKLIFKAYEKDDFSMIIALAPFASKDIIEKIVIDLDSELEFDKIKALAPFLRKESIAGIIISNGKFDIKKLRELAPFLGSALIDEIVQKMF